MGNDGGSIPKRVDMVRFKKKEVKADDELLNKPRGISCALSKTPFQQPLCIDRLGSIFNYELILRSLLKHQLPPQFCHIARLKDIRKIQYQEAEDRQWVIQCAITKQPYNGNSRFFVNWGCGCVISQKAYHELAKGDKGNCYVCQKKQDGPDMVSLNLTH